MIYCSKIKFSFYKRASTVWIILINRLTPKDKPIYHRLKRTIDSDGEIINSYTLEICGIKELDELVVKTSKDLPCWKPAKFYTEQVIM